MKIFACCSPGCAAKVVVPARVSAGWSAATCAYGHPCWVVRGVGKTVVMRRREDYRPSRVLRTTSH